MIARVGRLRAALILLGFVFAIPGHPAIAATLEQLTLDQMTDKATDIIYGRVLGSKIEMSGESIYTHYSVQTRDRWKGTNQLVMDVVLPGGETGGLRQSFAGVPALQTGKDYVMFLWTGRSGRTQLLGLTQGLFDVSETEAGELMASRGVSAELMLDQAGKAVQDQPIRMRMSDIGTRVKSLARGKATQ